MGGSQLVSSCFTIFRAIKVNDHCEVPLLAGLNFIYHQDDITDRQWTHSYQPLTPPLQHWNVLLHPPSPHRLHHWSQFVMTSSERRSTIRDLRKDTMRLHEGIATREKKVHRGKYFIIILIA